MKILIVGCERSGTTIVANLLAKSSGLSFLNDPKESWYIYPLVRVIGLRGMPISFVFKLWKYSIVKVPGFASILSHLRKVQITPFKVIYMVRDPRDNYAAIKERLKEDLNGLYLNINFLNLKGKNQCENVALRWNAYLNTALLYEEKYGNIKFVKYEDFLVNKLETITDIASFCKISIDTNLIVNDLNKQINKSWSNEIKGDRRYLIDLDKSEIDIICGITKDNMKKFNYDNE